MKEFYPTIDFKVLMLNDVNLKKCRGCYVCFLKGEKNCPLNDDRELNFFKKVLANRIAGKEIRKMMMNR